MVGAGGSVDVDRRGWGASQQDLVCERLTEWGYIPSEMSSEGLNRDGYNSFVFDGEGKKIVCSRSGRAVTERRHWKSAAHREWIFANLPLIRRADILHAHLEWVGGEWVRCEGFDEMIDEQLAELNELGD